MATYKNAKVAGALPSSPLANAEYLLKKGDRVEHYVTDISGNPFPVREPIIQQFAGQFLLDPNEYNGWGPQGFVDETNATDLNNVGAANLISTTGGFVFPFPVKLTGFYASHRNSIATAQAWGWCFYYQTKTASSNTVTTTFLRDESFNRGDGFFGLRNYSNTLNQETVLTSSDFVDTVIPANTVIGVCVGAPTAVTTNYYIQVMGGYFQFEKQ